MLGPGVACRPLLNPGWLPAALPARIRLFRQSCHQSRQQGGCRAMADDDLDALYEQYTSKPPPRQDMAARRAAMRLEEQQRRKAQQEAAAAAAAAAARAHAGAPVVAASGPPPPLLVTRTTPMDDVSLFSSAAFLIDKPLGWTSFDVCNAIKGALRPIGITKVGHAGTLDPNASGLLIVCTGAATKAIDAFTAASKCYTGTLRLGEATASQDADTPVDATAPWEHITDADIAAGAARLTGDITQVPPMYSAVHHEGRRLYELAREGATVERPARPVTITSFSINRDPQEPRCLHFAVECSKGTYIRTLCADLAEGLGSLGHMTSLVRTGSGPHRLEDAWQMQPLLDAIWQLVKGSGALGRGGKPLTATYTYTPRLKRSRSSSPDPDGDGEGQGLSRRQHRKQKRQREEARLAAADAEAAGQPPSQDVAMAVQDQAAAAADAATQQTAAEQGQTAAAAAASGNSSGVQPAEGAPVAAGSTADGLPGQAAAVSQ